MSPPVFLVGFMGTGKSEAGRRLAERLGWAFLDLDDAIAAESGRSIPEIFETEGEAGFRRRERAALLEAFERTDTVVACGGGVVVTPGNLRDLRERSRVVCLTASPETIHARVGGDPNRPLLRGKGDPVDHLRRLLAAREPLYAQLPRRIDTDGLRPSEVVDRLLSELRNP